MLGRRDMKAVYSTIAVGVTLVLFFSKNADAYLGPGTGSMLLQALMAAFAGGFVVMRAYWSERKRLFTSSKKAAKKPNAEVAATENTSK
jgi:hypothetical protein